MEHIQRGGHWGGIHLNERGTEVLKQNFIDFINTWYRSTYTRVSCARPHGELNLAIESRPLLTHEVESSTNESETICEAHEAAFDDTGKDAKTLISEYRTKNKDKVVLATLNINSLRNKFTSLMELVSGNIDILVIEETKIDSTFPEAQFCIPGYKTPFRKDRNAHDGE